MFMSGATIITKSITTSSLPQRIPLAQRPALPVFCGVGRGSATRVTLVPLSAVGAALITVTSATGFGWFVSWISSVVILDLCFSELLKGPQT
jgi:hypothetical protein